MVNINKLLWNSIKTEIHNVGKKNLINNKFKIAVGITNELAQYVRKIKNNKLVNLMEKNSSN